MPIGESTRRDAITRLVIQLGVLQFGFWRVDYSKHSDPEDNWPD